MSIIETNINISTRSINKDSEAKKDFITALTNGFFCYESPKKEQVSHVFKHLIANIKSYNVDKI